MTSDSLSAAPAGPLESAPTVGAPAWTAAAPAEAGAAARLRALFDLHLDGVLSVAPEGRIGDANAAAAALLGAPADELRGRDVRSLFAPEDVEGSAERLAAAMLGAPQSWEATLAGEGARSTVHLAAVPIVEDGLVMGAYLIAHDVTPHRVLEAQLAHRAFHDPLTGLANRALFRDRVEQALARDPTGEHVAVIFVDLDDFKKVNDTQGTPPATRCWSRVAAMLVESTRGCDLIARFGGDEFAVLLARIAHPDHVSAVAARIAAALRRPIALPERAVVVGASLGIARGHPATNADELLREADLAMYRAKAAGKGHLATYAAGALALAEERAALTDDLRRALEGDASGGRLSLVYQPVVELATGRVSTYEALARWWHPARGEVPPSTFVPLAEDTGLVVTLGRWVLRAACAQLQRWQAAAPEAERPTVRVNMSRCELEQPTLLRDVADALESAGITAGQLTLELPESAVMRRPEEALVTLHGLRELGVRLAIDDFGTGASSLGHLPRFPVDELKIDRGFVNAAPEDAEAEAVVRATIALGHALRLRLVAEGVERPSQRAWLADVGCDMGQGYLFAEPGAPDRIHGVPDRPACPASVSRASRAPIGRRRGAAAGVTAPRDPRDEIARARSLLGGAERLLVFTGAGVSAESGVPTFRGAGGVWNSLRAEELATPQAFARDPRLVWEWYGWRRELVATCLPNPAHHAVARVAAARPDTTVVTQNVDGLHQRAAAEAAGGAPVVALHGTLFGERCARWPACATRGALAADVDATREATLPRCPACGALLRPDVVWFGEPLDAADLEAAFAAAGRADACLVVGTSAVVQPAASVAAAARPRRGAPGRGERRGHAAVGPRGGVAARARGRAGAAAAGPLRRRPALAGHAREIREAPGRVDWAWA
jgi:diguanylate cyclase (GGDEF)-like protein/PAS domain S-box-containing protein